MYFSWKLDQGVNQHKVSLGDDNRTRYGCCSWRRRRSTGEATARDKKWLLETDKQIHNGFTTRVKRDRSKTTIARGHPMHKLLFCQGRESYAGRILCGRLMFFDVPDSAMGATNKVLFVHEEELQRFNVGASSRHYRGQTGCASC